MIDGSSSPELLPAWIEAIATAGGVLVAVVAIVFTFLQIRLASLQLRRAAIREAQDSEERTRPYIGLDVVPGLAGAPSFDLIITNFGRATAKRIRIDLRGAGFEAQSEGDEIGPALGRLFARPFDLAPGARRRVFWYMPAQADATPSGALGVPIAGEVSASYEWERTDADSRVYEDWIAYDLTEYPKLTPQPTEGSTANGSAGDPEIIGRNAVNALRAIARHVGETRR